MNAITEYSNLSWEARIRLFNECLATLKTQESVIAKAHERIGELEDKVQALTSDELRVKRIKERQDELDEKLENIKPWILEQVKPKEQTK